MKIKNMTKITMAGIMALGLMVPAVNATEGDIIDQVVETANSSDTTILTTPHG